MIRLGSVIFSFLSLSAAIGQEKMVLAPVSEVTVYQQGAFVTRNSTLQVQAGLQKVVFTGLPQYLEQNKLFASAEDDIKIISVATVTNRMAASMQALLQKQRDSLSEIQNETNLLNAYQQNYQKEYALIEYNKVASNKESSTVVELEKLANLYRSRLAELSKLMHANQLKIKDLNQMQSDISKRLSFNTNQHSNKSSVELTIKSKVSRTTNLALKYFVSNTGWSTLYNFRFAGIDKPCQLDISASVYNNSGDEWENTKLTLSTATPLRSLQPEAFSSWVVNQFLRKAKSAYEMDMVTNNLNVKRAWNAAGTDMESNISENATEMTVTYALEDKISLTIASPTSTVELKTINTEPVFKHYVNLASCDDTYLTANITGWQKWRITSGPVNIYNYGELNGTTQINTYQLSDTLQIPLGIDKNVVIKYKTLRDNREKIMLSSNYKHEFAYEITVKNNNTRPINIEMIDQVPISTSDKITIETSQLSGAEYDATTGKVLWRNTIEPGKGKVQNLAFTIKYPREQVLNISGYQQRRL